MRLLLDTHTLLWYAAGDPKLSAGALNAINAADAISVVSVASLWEMSVKVGTGRLSLGEDLATFWARHESNGVELMTINKPEVLMAGQLDFHHRDPFDRLLASQSIVYQIPSVSVDDVLDKYGV